MFGKASCANCQFEFTQSFVSQTLGKLFYKNVAVPNIIRELMMVQRANLETVDVVAEVTWMEECARIKSLARFGASQHMPDKPEITGHVISVRYPCTIGSCRGIVLNGSCNACSGVLCNLCHCEKKDVSNGLMHHCDPDDVAVIQSSKQCPACLSLIQHGGGCDAMICTNCGTKFNWQTGVVQQHNSNSHYSGRDIYGKTRDDVAQRLGCVASIDHDRVARDTLEQEMDSTIAVVGHTAFVRPPEVLLSVLYAVTESVRHYSRSQFDQLKITNAWIKKTHELRIQYLTKKIGTAKWEALVYASWRQYRCHMLHAPIIELFLAMTDEYQLRTWDAVKVNAIPSVYQGILDEYRELVTISNDGFDAVHDAFPVLFAPFYIRPLDDELTNACAACGLRIIVEQPPDRSSTGVDPATASELPPSKDIQLFGYQVGHVENLQAILDKCHFGLDFSMLGAGKTYAAMEIYKLRGYRRGLIVAPASMIEKWRELTSEYGLQGITVISFNALAGTKIGGVHSSVNHMIRRGDMMAETDDASHVITAQFRQYVAEGIMVIIDEIQNIKNKGTAKTSACKEIVNAICDEFKRTGGTTPSRALLISGSPIDNYAQVEQFFKTVGVMKSTQFARYDIGTHSRERAIYNRLGAHGRFTSTAGTLETGMLEIRTFCTKYDEYETASICLGEHASRQARSPLMECYEYFTKVVKPQLSSYMTVTGNPHTVTKYNGKYVVQYTRDERVEGTTSDIFKLLDKGVKRVSAAMSAANGEDGRHATLEVIQAMQRGLNMIETSKIPLFVQLIREAAAQNPQCKIVVACNFTQTILDLRRLLPELNPCVVNGAVPAKQRQKLLNRFQAPTLDTRLLIGNTKVISTGIDLDDKHGAYPRVCFVSPSYHTIDLYQLSYRFLRSVDTKSNTTMYMVYASGSPELHLIRALSSKGTIMKTITVEQSRDANITFPCDYEDHIPDRPEKWMEWNRECDRIFETIQLPKDDDVSDDININNANNADDGIPDNTLRDPPPEISAAAI